MFIFKKKNKKIEELYKSVKQFESRSDQLFSQKPADQDIYCFPGSA